VTMKKFILPFILAAPVLVAVAPVLSKTAKPAASSAPLPAPASAEAIKKQIAARKGRVVLVNFWATWCTACVEELPTIAKLEKQNSKKLAVMLVSGDEMKDRAKAGQLLKQKGHNGASWIIAGNQEAFLKKFDPKSDGFALPVTYLYGRDGKLIKVFPAEEAGKLSATVARLLK
jgi:thiol-disulfide isomerase/thioredoxin